MYNQNTPRAIFPVLNPTSLSPDTDYEFRMTADPMNNSPLAPVRITKIVNPVQNVLNVLTNNENISTWA